MLGLRGLLGVAAERLAQGLIFVRLRRERVEPLGDIAVLERLLHPCTHVRLGARDGIHLVKFRRIGVPVGKRGRIFQPGLDECLAFLAALQEQVRLEAVRRRVRDGIADLLLGVAVERDSRLLRSGVALGLVGGIAHRAGGNGGA